MDGFEDVHLVRHIERAVNLKSVLTRRVCVREKGSWPTPGCDCFDERS